MRSGFVSPWRLFALLVTAVLCGCGYTLQTKSNLPFDTVAIGTIENRTFEPKLQDRLSVILADTFMEYGIRVVPSSSHVVQAVVTHFDLKTLSEIDLTTSEYQVTITGDFTLLDRETGTAVPLMKLQSPYLTYFFATGVIENVLAQKELATDRALRDLSQELVRRIIYAAPVGKAAQQ
jgi:outer membrane lipopolysaccharide assembly protein LptE/RlpB